jgi:hypothetical protein
LRIEKQRENHILAKQFVGFSQREDPTVLHTITAVSETATHGDAAHRLGVSEYEYFRMHEVSRKSEDGAEGKTENRSVCV